MISNKKKFLFTLLVALSCQLLYAEEDENAISKAKETAKLAKMAKAKAQLRMQQAQVADDERSPVASFDSQGCDINIGNVALDGLSDAPDEITILIDGDIIQSNNCR